MAVNDIRLNDADRAILRALEDGRNLAANLEDEIDYERHYINQRLRRLAEHGVVTNLGNGLYELADDHSASARATTAEPLRGLVGLLDEEEAAAARERSREWREAFDREMLGEDDG